jgi:hypothetical protein
MLHCRKANAILILSVGLKILYMIAVRDYFDRFIIILDKVVFRALVWKYSTPLPILITKQH